jgi:aromatic-L-amino-acid/L-tryptophan decarboxylase
METGRFGELLARIGSGLDGFNRFEHEDAIVHRETWERLADEPLPEIGRGIDAVADELLGPILAGSARIADPGFWGFITTGPTTAPVIAQTLALVAAPQRASITAFHRLEERSLDLLADLLGLPPHMKGVYSSGGSTANLVALGAARQWAFEQGGLDPAADGVTRRSTIYASTEVHHTVNRAAAVLGLGRSCIRAIPADDRQRLDVAALATTIDADIAAGLLPIAVVATAGTTNTGAIDPLRAAGSVAHERGIWFHVDGAYGLPGILDDRIADRYDGIELADSAIVDPHKWLAAPVGVAATYVRDRAVLVRAFTQEPAAYLEGSFSGDDDVQTSLDSIGIPYSDMGVELSSPSRGVVVWSILREEGRQGLVSRVRRDNDLARRVDALAREHPRLESLIEPELSIACFRYVGDASGACGLDELNTRILSRLRRETPWMPSATVVRGAFALRPCFINPRTRPEHVEELVRTVVFLGDELTAPK